MIFQTIPESKRRTSAFLFIYHNFTNRNAENWYNGNKKLSTKSENIRMQKPPKQSFQISQIVPFVVFLFVGGLGGYWMGRSLAQNSAVLSSLPDAVVLGALLLLFLLALFVQIIFHEAGHLVFGLLTGYRFSSFRVGSWMLVKDADRLRLKALSIAGTGGQCIMLPPAWNGERSPFVLYNLGGALMNFFTSALFFLLYSLVPLHPFVSAFFGALTATGLALGLLNAIPLRFALVDNDGGNIRLLKKDPQAAYSFYRMLDIHGRLACGLRLRDMPEDWFVTPDGSDTKNPIVSTIEVFAINRLMDCHAFLPAAARIRTLFASGATINGIHRNLLQCDLAYCCMLEGDTTAARLALDEPLKKFMQSMKRFPSVLRTQYSEALLLENDSTKADAFLAKFDQMAKKYPYMSDIESERELIQIARESTPRIEPHT